MAPFLFHRVQVVQGGRQYAVKSRALSMLAAYESERAVYTFSGKSSGIYYGIQTTWQSGGFI